jgi:hypothetical protein
MKKARSSRRINKIGTTTDTITGRGGLVLFSRYLDKLPITRLRPGDLDEPPYAGPLVGVVWGLGEKNPRLPDWVLLF